MPGRCHHEPSYEKYRGGPTQTIEIGHTVYADGREEPVLYEQNVGYHQALSAYLDSLIPGVCEYGNCSEGYCPQCGAVSYAEGPILCPCDDTIMFHEQRKAVGPNFVKPSLRRRGWRRRR
jgi:hypothetical protein